MITDFSTQDKKMKILDAGGNYNLYCGGGKLKVFFDDIKQIYKSDYTLYRDGKIVGRIMGDMIGQEFKENLDILVKETGK